MYLKLTNGQPEIYSTEQLRRDNPQVSFPSEKTDALLAEYGVYPYTRATQPDVDWLTSTVVDGNFEQDTDGKWVQPCIVEKLPLTNAKQNVRSQRDSLLQQTDWMALSDVVMPPAMVSYRQALRDITSQAGFPYNVVWPTKP